MTMPPWWPRGRELLLALLSARAATKDTLASAPQSLPQTEPTLGLLCQLAERAYEHVAASLVCFATKNAATAEVAARVAIESSVNIRFILSGDRNSLALAWLRAYVTHDTKQIDLWEKQLDSVPLDEKKEYVPRISARRQVNRYRRDFLVQSEKEFRSFGPLELEARWPSVADRFESIGEGIAYRTTYARLSSQTHADAEDTLNYIVFKCIGDDGLLLKMSKETVAFSEFLIAYGVYFYLLAMKTLCETFRLPAPTALERSITRAVAHMEENRATWGW